MAAVTLRVIDGADRGRVYDALGTPVTIGREEGNAVQLNDDRVSRFHLKIQEDHDRLVLTDLESTNGTKVNGEDIQLRILRHGDMICVGRSILLFGTPHEIEDRMATLRGEALAAVDHSAQDGDGSSSSQSKSDLDWDDKDDLHATIHMLEPPELPHRLSPAQAAQLSELIEYLHLRIRRLLATVEMDEEERRIVLSMEQWQYLLDLQARLAIYLRQIGEPGDS
jgi:pSer/pThr/pTyr-binding forkhead associated (FHA) protein